MKIWNTTIGEPLPIDGSVDRLHRSGLLNEILVRSGHEVKWWSSSFNHFSKKYYRKQRTTIEVFENYTLELLHGRQYTRNISFSRILNHIQIGKQFNLDAYKAEKPDLIITSFPSIELAYYSVKYAMKKNIPIVVDARDMWPDIFTSVLPSSLSPIIKFLLFKYFRMTNFVFSNASSIIGITEGFVNWGLNHGIKKRSHLDKSFYLGYPELELGDEKETTSWKKFESFNLKQDDFILTYIGAITKNKINLQPILKAAEHFKDISKIKFVVAGDGDERENFIKTSNRLGLKNIVFPGWLNKYEIKNLLKNSDFGLVPLRNRFDYKLAIPNKPIEYIANQLPILSGLEGELKSLIKDNNIGFTYKTYKELIEKINDIFSNQNKLNKMSKNCKELYQKKFDSKLVYTDLANHLFEVKNILS